MSSHDAPTKTPAPAHEPDRLGTHGDANAGAKAPVLTEVEARQAVTGHNVRYVLLWGLVAVVIAFVAILAFDFYR